MSGDFRTEPQKGEVCGRRFANAISTPAVPQHGRPSVWTYPHGRRRVSHAFHNRCGIPSGACDTLSVMLTDVVVDHRPERTEAFASLSFSSADLKSGTYTAGA